MHIPRLILLSTGALYAEAMHWQKQCLIAEVTEADTLLKRLNAFKARVSLVLEYG